MQWTATSWVAPHWKHCPSSRSQTRFFRFSGTTGSPALVISSNHLGMRLHSPLEDRVAILLALALPAQGIRVRRLQVLPVPLEDGLEVGEEPLLKARRHPVDAVHRPFFDLLDIQPFFR